jgi:hypothetical protein
MTITARHVHRRLERIGPYIEDIFHRLPVVVVAVRAEDDKNIDERRAAAAPGGDADGIKPIGRVSDPTSAAALRNMAFTSRHLDNIAADLDLFLAAAYRLVEHCDRWVVSAANAEPHPRCNGGGGVDDWCDPTCTEYVMHTTRANGSYSYNRDGLCTNCYQRRRRYHKMLEEQGAA